jgi:hypothetical protein
MDIHRLCASFKEKVAAELQATADPLARGDILMAALYEVDRSVFPELGLPKKSEEYLQKRAAVVDLITFIAIPLIRNAEQDRRGVAVLSELGETCPDPLLKKKLAVYAQELLAKSAPEGPKSPALSFVRIFFAAGMTSLFLFLLYWVCPMPWSQPHSASLTVASEPEPLRPQAPAGAVSALAPVGALSSDVVASRDKPNDEPRQQEKPAGQEQVTRVRVVSNQVLVPVLLKNGGESVRVELVLDTGATRTAIHDGLVSRLKIDLRNAKASQSELADGRIVTSRVAKIDALQVGPFATPSAELEVIPYKGSEGIHDGLLGMDFLGKHRYQIDMEHETIRWY